MSETSSGSGPTKCKSCGQLLSTPTATFCEGCGSPQGKVKQCVHCNEQIPEYAKFCTNCGKPNLLRRKTKECIGCQKQLPETAKFCVDCGQDQSASPQKKVKQCVKCSIEIDESMTFCGKCGHNQSLPISQNNCILCSAPLPSGAQNCPICFAYQDPEMMKSISLKECPNTNCQAQLVYFATTCYKCKQSVPTTSEQVMGLQQSSTKQYSQESTVSSLPSPVLKRCANTLSNCNCFLSESAEECYQCHCRQPFPIPSELLVVVQPPSPYQLSSPPCQQQFPKIAANFSLKHQVETNTSPSAQSLLSYENSQLHTEKESIEQKNQVVPPPAQSTHGSDMENPLKESTVNTGTPSMDVIPPCDGPNASGPLEEDMLPTEESQKKLPGSAQKPLTSDEGVLVPTSTSADFNISSSPSVSSGHDVSMSSSCPDSQSSDSSQPNTMEMNKPGSEDNRRDVKRFSDNESPSNSPGKRYKTDSVENIPSLVNTVATDDPAHPISLSSEAKEGVLASGKNPTGEEMHSDTSGKRTKPAHDFEKEMSASDGDEEKHNEHEIVLDENVNTVTSSEGNEGASTAGVLQPTVDKISSEGDASASTAGTLQPTVDSSSENKDNSITVSPERQRRTMPDGPEKKDNREDNSKPLEELPVTLFNTNDLNQTNGKFVAKKPSTLSQSTDTSFKSNQPTDEPGSNEHSNRKRIRDESTVVEPPLKKGVECTEKSDLSQLLSEKQKSSSTSVPPSNEPNSSTTQDVTSPENDGNADDDVYGTPPSSPGTKTPPEKEEHKEDPLFIGEDSGSSSLSSPASNTDKGNGSDCSSERNETESEVYPHKKSEHQPVLYNGKGDKNTNSKKKGKQKSHEMERSITKPLSVKETPGFSTNPEKSVTVVFHAILPCSVWEWDQESEVYIRFGNKDLGDWKHDCGPLQTSSSVIGGHYLLVSGEFNISPNTLKGKIPYKYTVFSPKTRHASEKDNVFERLYFDNPYNTGISPEYANRVLKVPPNIKPKVQRLQ